MPAELTSWDDFDKLAHVPGPSLFGFRTDLADVNRFAARYRAARSFKSIDLKGSQMLCELAT